MGATANLGRYATEPSSFPDVLKAHPARSPPDAPAVGGLSPRPYVD